MPHADSWHIKIFQVTICTILRLKALDRQAMSVLTYPRPIAQALPGDSQNLLWSLFAGEYDRACVADLADLKTKPASSSPLFPFTKTLG